MKSKSMRCTCWKLTPTYRSTQINWAWLVSELAGNRVAKRLSKLNKENNYELK